MKRRCHKTIAGLAWLAALLAVGAPLPAAADVIELTNGGQLHGEVADADQADPEFYDIATTDGSRIRLARSEVDRVVSMPAAETEHARRRLAAGDDAGAHWQLALWCRENDLDQPYQQQLERVVELDPDHQQARSALGQKLHRGQWKTQDEIMADRGMVRYQGKFVTQHHVKLLKQLDEQREAAGEWNGRIKRWRRWLTGRRQQRVAEALEKIRAVRDPLAAPAIADWLSEETNTRTRRLLVDVVAQIDDPLMSEALANLSLYDPDPETRYQCLDHLLDRRPPGLIRPYIRALQSADNTIVNRAAEALGTIGNRDAIGPLIDALVTEHKFRSGGGSSNQHAYMFTPEGGTAMGFGNSKPKVVTRTAENRGVLSALTKLAGGASFGYDQRQWRQWLATQAEANPIDLRRDS